MGIVATFMVPHPPMIVPEIGRGSEAMIQETISAYEKVADEIARLKPETIIITSPHSVLYYDYFHISPGASATGSFARFGAPEVSFFEEYDEELREKLCQLAEKADFPAGTLGEKDSSLDHGTMVPLWFIRNKYKEGKILRIGLSGLSLSKHYEFGELIQAAVEESGKNVVFVASGDLSHKLKEDGPYGFAPEGPVYDEKIMDVAGRGAFREMLEFDEGLCERAAECGHRSFVIMAGALDGCEVDAKTHSHQDVTGVGYGIASFYPKETDAYVKLARASLKSFILQRKVLQLPKVLPEEMTKTQAGAFVSIHKNGYLRGCIGTFLPTTDCVAEEILQNAISAATRDPRFSEILPEEIPYLDINVDVLSEPEPISSKDELDVKRYGVIVTSGRKRGLLLPDLEGVDTVEEQIDIARQKAGILPEAEIELQRFEVVRHI